MRAFSFAAIALLSACSAEPAPMITVSDARATVISTNAAAYFTLTNSGGKDRLLSVQAGDAGTATMHDTVMESDVMSMKPIVEGVEVPAGGTVRFSAMGRHVMIMGERPIVAPTVTLTLRFERQGDVRVVAPVTGPRG